MLRPYLADQTFLGRRFNGAARCNRLITLGSPHQALRATPLRARVDREFPGCPEADRVDYVAVAGRLDPLGANASNIFRAAALPAAIARSWATRICRGTVWCRSHQPCCGMPVGLSSILC